MIEDIKVGDQVVSYDLVTCQLYMDNVILVNRHDNFTGICKTLRFYFDKDEEVSLELEKHHLALVREEDGTCTEKEASKVKPDDHMLIFEGGRA